MKVQKVVVEEKSYPLYILLDKNFEVVEPVKRYIKYLDNTSQWLLSFTSNCGTVSSRKCLFRLYELLYK